MRKNIIISVLCLLAAALPVCADDSFLDQPDIIPYTRFDYSWLKLSVQPWLTQANSHYRTSWTGDVPAPYIPGTGGVTANFRHTDSLLWVFSAEAQLSSKFSLGAEYAANRLDGGSVDNHSWFNNPDGSVTILDSGTVWENPNYRDYSVQSADLSGNTRMMSATLYYRLNEHAMDTMEGKIYGKLDIFAGYGIYQDTMRMTNGYQVFADTSAVPSLDPAGTLIAMDQNYNTRWEGFQTGFRETITIAREWGITGKFAWWPGVKYHGEMTYNNPAFLHFTHDADGYQMDYSLAVNYAPYKNSYFSLGFRGLQYVSRSGKVIYYNSDGSINLIAQLDEASATRQGWFAAAVFKY